MFEGEGVEPALVSDRGREGRVSREAIFVRAYMRTMSAAAAARAAYGYGEAVAKWRGFAILKRPRVRDAVEQATRRLLAKYGVTPERTVSEAARLAFANILDYLEVDGDGLASVNLAGVTYEEGAAITEVVTDVLSDGTKRTRLKLGNKLAALELLFKYQKLLAPEAQVNVGRAVFVIEGAPEMAGSAPLALEGSVAA